MVSFITVVVVQLNCVWLIVTPWTAAHQPSLSFTISQSLLKPMSIESVMPSHHLILCRPLLFLPPIFPSFRVFSNELTLHQVAKVLKLQVQHQFLKWMLRVGFLEDWLIWSPCYLRYSEESSLAPQFKSINSLDGRDRQKRQQASEGIVSCEKCHTENQMMRGRSWADGDYFGHDGAWRVLWEDDMSWDLEWDSATVSLLWGPGRSIEPGLFALWAPPEPPAPTVVTSAF